MRTSVPTEGYRTDPAPAEKKETRTYTTTNPRRKCETLTLHLYTFPNPDDIAHGQSAAFPYWMPPMPLYRWISKLPAAQWLAAKSKAAPLRPLTFRQPLAAGLYDTTYTSDKGTNYENQKPGTGTTPSIVKSNKTTRTKTVDVSHTDASKDLTSIESTVHTINLHLDSFF